MAKNTVRQYKVSFKEGTSAMDRGEIDNRLNKMGLLSSVSMQTERSGPFGLEYLHQIELIKVTTLDDSEDALFKYALKTEKCFSVCIVTEIK